MTDWRDRAACRGEGPRIFYEAESRSQALSFCRRCEVRQKCLAVGLHEVWGTWGGTWQQERQRLRRELRKAS